VRSIALFAVGLFAAALAQSVPPLPPKDSSLSLTDYNFSDELLARGRVFVKFFAPWCGHCKALAPTWEALARDVHGAPAPAAAADNGSYPVPTTIASVDCTVNPITCKTFGVRSYPTLILMQAPNTGSLIYYQRRADGTVAQSFLPFDGTNAAGFSEAGLLLHHESGRDLSTLRRAAIDQAPRQVMPPLVQASSVSVVYDVLAGLRKDADEVWRLRKNIALLIAVLGFLAGFVANMFLCGCRSRRWQQQLHGAGVTAGASDGAGIAGGAVKAGSRGAAAAPWELAPMNRGKED